MKAASRTRGSTIGEEEKAHLSIGSSEIGGRTMCSSRLAAQAAATSASLVQSGRFDICPPVQEKYEAEFNPLHMNWALVDDTKGNQQAPNAMGG
jgi:hypothetical protein